SPSAAAICGGRFPRSSASTDRPRASARLPGDLPVQLVLLLVDVALLAARQAAAILRLLARLAGDLAVLVLQLARLAAGDVARAVFLIDALVGVVDAVLHLVLALLLDVGVLRLSSGGHQHAGGENGAGDLQQEAHRFAPWVFRLDNYALRGSGVAAAECGSSVADFG